MSQPNILFRPSIRHSTDQTNDWAGDQSESLPAEVHTTKVICVGRNYSDHAKELNNPVPKSPLLFIKPETSLCQFDKVIFIPTDSGECHHELELALLVGKRLHKVEPNKVQDAIAGIGLALDLTLRDAQSRLKSKGQPWEIAKAFDGSCPVSDFIPVSDLNMPMEKIEFALKVNDEYRQKGIVSEMIFPIAQLVAEMSQHFTLRAGDIVLTGTPAGVAALSEGDKLQAELNGALLASAIVRAGE